MWAWARGSRVLLAWSQPRIPQPLRAQCCSAVLPRARAGKALGLSPTLLASKRARGRSAQSVSWHTWPGEPSTLGVPVLAEQSTPGNLGLCRVVS